jgi:hypothetical protein
MPPVFAFLGTCILVVSMLIIKRYCERVYQVRFSLQTWPEPRHGTPLPAARCVRS